MYFILGYGASNVSKLEFTIGGNYQYNRAEVLRPQDLLGILYSTPH